MSDPVRRLKTYGRDLGSIPISRIPRELEKVCFICVNTYTSFRLNLGTGPISDAVAFAKCLKTFGHEVYFINNPHSRNFLKYLDAFFQATSNELVLYYVGQGTSSDSDEDEDVQKNEAFAFDDGIITNDELANHIAENKQGNCRVILVTDIGSPGSIWDIRGTECHGAQIPDNVLSISASPDTSCAKQTQVNRQEEGIFTYNLTKILKKNPMITPRELQAQMKPILRKYQQVFS